MTSDIGIAKMMLRIRSNKCVAPNIFPLQQLKRLICTKKYLIMGIHGLMKLITEEAPLALKEKEMDNLNDRKVAIDASMAIYQFLVAVRTSGPGGASAQLTNEAGDVTSHIQGMFNRTIKMMESGVKVVYVFDGKPPQMKGGELAKRIAKRAKAETDLSAANEAGDVDDIDKFSRRLVKATRQHSEVRSYPRSDYTRTLLLTLFISFNAEVVVRVVLFSCKGSHLSERLSISHNSHLTALCAFSFYS